MNMQMQPDDGCNSTALTPQEKVLLEELQQLAAEGKQEVDREMVALASRSLQWHFADAASLARAANFMAQDPFMRREVEAINQEFDCFQGDPLTS